LSTPINLHSDKKKYCKKIIHINEIPSLSTPTSLTTHICKQYVIAGSNIIFEQSEPTKKTKKYVNYVLIIITHPPYAIIWYGASDVVLNVHSDGVSLRALQHLARRKPFLSLKHPTP